MQSAVPSLCLVAMLAACVGPPAAVDPPQQPEDFAAAMARVRAQEPGAVPRDAGARHIDQQEPPLPGTGQRRYYGSDKPVAVTLQGGVGTVHVAAPGTTLDDRARAVFVRLGIDTAVHAPRGAALHLQAFGSEDDLFAGRQINDGVAPARADADLRGVDAFPHLRCDLLAHDTLRLPIRIGVFADRIDIDHAAGVERSWISVGPRVLVEPSWRWLGDAEHGLGLTGRLGGEVAATWLREEFRGGEDTDQTMRWAAQAGAGLRGTLGGVHLDLGYQLDAIWFDATTTELYGRRSGTEMLRHGVMFGGTILF